MSAFYWLISHVSRFFQKLFRKSLLFTIIFAIAAFVEEQWVNSYFKSFYPSSNFLGVFKRSNILTNHIFSPAIVIIVFALFLMLSINPISVNLQINLAIAFISFLIGSFIISRYFFKENQNVICNISKDKARNCNENGQKQEKFSFIKFNKDDIYSIGFCLVLVGIAFFFLSVASAGGIPLLKPSLRYALKPIFTMPVFLMIPGIGLMFSAYLDKFKGGIITKSQIRFRFLILAVISSSFLLALGYRTPIIAVLLMTIIIGYYGKILAVWEVIIGALAAISIIIGIGYFRSLEEFMITTNTSPLYSLQSRADFTLHVLNLLSYISGDFGITHGSIILSSIPGSELGPRMMIGTLIAWRTEVTVTPTLIGPMLLDFGRVGLVIGMGILGFILGIGYKLLQKTKDSFYIVIYAILLTYTILGVETGILDINVIIYFVLGFLLYLANILKNSRFNNE
ncbi:hypothetical protein MBCUT_14820 [Methanobrevibacter cuticularis]|uniref:Oligosaccharide repeat unit polymerase n=1 Tax=Methanobrevibacter cuticularis TaxID=47311 RepID=A0A166DDU2_9EURY|nr:oligosaccharide repeat unit polymerase family protein [Methanobrevibacter cuticularis]KZX15485.1 hypothetical protein MBCUT_14820 [Methanobrevibacter cuticularis]